MRRNGLRTTDANGHATSVLPMPRNSDHGGGVRASAIADAVIAEASVRDPWQLMRAVADALEELEQRSGHSREELLAAAATLLSEIGVGDPLCEKGRRH